MYFRDVASHLVVDADIFTWPTIEDLQLFQLGLSIEHMRHAGSANLIGLLEYERPDVILLLRRSLDQFEPGERITLVGVDGVSGVSRQRRATKPRGQKLREQRCSLHGTHLLPSEVTV
jgi:hypothetical protein